MFSFCGLCDAVCVLVGGALPSEALAAPIERSYVYLCVNNAIQVYSNVNGKVCNINMITCVRNGAYSVWMWVEGKAMAEAQADTYVDCVEVVSRGLEMLVGSGG